MEGPSFQPKKSLLRLFSPLRKYNQEQQGGQRKEKGANGEPQER